VPEKDGDFGRNDRNADVDEEHNRCEPGQQSDDQQRAAKHFAYTNKRPHNLRRGNAYFRKAFGCKLRRIKKLLNPLGQENAAGQQPHQKSRRGRIRRKKPMHNASGLRCELCQIVNAESLLDSRYSIYNFLEAAFAEEFVFLFLKIFAQRIEFMRRDDFAECGK